MKENTPQVQEGWRERFDETFLVTRDVIDPVSGRPEGRVIKHWRSQTRHQDIKTFIAQERQALLDEMRGKINHIPTRDALGGFRHIEVYKEDVLSIIDKAV